MTTGYSDFFSSGLLAPPVPYTRPRYDSTSSTMSSVSTLSSASNSTVTTTISDALDDASDIEDPFSSNHARGREITPTPQPPKSPKRTLRKRKSSLSVQTSPLQSLRSPNRAAESALAFQRHLHGTPSRPRSGSVNSAATEATSMLGRLANVAEGPVGITGRMRSGSVGTALRSRQRSIRHIPTNPLPPPSLPLPPLPPLPKTFTNPSTPQKIHGRSFSFQPRGVNTGAVHLQRLPTVPGTPPSHSKMDVTPVEFFVPPSPRTPLGAIQHGYGRMDED
ncbi:hypothetical protein PQX77_005550 [Marasmius sp. AFHP31]|nr:hypothetical protein PQX77_005550 [Marasmius sp. AFHP31]